MRVVATEQKWSVFVPISDLVLTLLRLWRVIRLEEPNRLSLANWMIQFTRVTFSPDEMIVEAAFDHDSFENMCAAELEKVVLMMSVRLQRAVRAFLHRRRVRRRGGGHLYHTISSEQKRSRTPTPSSSQGQRKQPPKSAPLASTAPILAMPTFDSVTRYAQQLKTQSAGRAVRNINSSGPNNPRSAPKVSSRGIVNQTTPTAPDDSLLFQQLMTRKPAVQTSPDKKDTAADGLEGLKFDVSGSFFDGYTPADSGSIFLLKGSEEFPSLPSSAGGRRSKPHLDSSFHRLNQPAVSRDRSRGEDMREEQQAGPQSDMFVPSSRAPSSSQRRAKELQKTTDDFGFNPSTDDMAANFVDDNDGDDRFERQFDEENYASNVQKNDLASLFDSRIISDDIPIANPPKKNSTGKKKPGSAPARSKASSRATSAAAISRGNTAASSRGTTAATSRGTTANSSRGTTATSRSTRNTGEGTMQTQQDDELVQETNDAVPVPRRQPAVGKKMTRRRETPSSSDGRKTPFTPHIPMAKRAQTIKEEREVRRLQEEVDDMKKQMTSLRRKVRYRDRKIREITPIYLQPKNERYRIAAEILQPVIRAHQQKKFFQKKWAELHAELKESDDGGFVREALQIAVESGNVAMATDAIRRSFEVVSALNDSKHQHTWHGIQFIPTNHDDIRLICDVIQAFVSIEEVTTFGLQLLSLISALHDFPDSFEVTGAAGGCDVVMIVLSRYCEDKVMCANALKLCKRLTKTSVSNRERCISVSHCRSFCTILLRQMNILPVLEKTVLLIRSFCIDVSDAIGIFQHVGLFDNLTYCMRTHKESELFSEFCKTITTICCKEGATNPQIRKDFGVRSNCLIYIDGLVANQHDSEAFKHVAVMMVCICENNKEGFENMVTDHLLTSLSNIMNARDTIPKTRKNTFDLIYNLIRHCPEDKSCRKIYNKLEILLSQDDDDYRMEDVTATFDQSFSDRSLHDSFLEIGLGTMVEDSLMRADQNRVQGDMQGTRGAQSPLQSDYRARSLSVEEDGDKSVVTFRHQIKDLAVETGNQHNDADDRYLDTSIEEDDEVDQARPMNFLPVTSEESKFTKPLNHEKDIDGDVDDLILGIVRNIRESTLTLFNDASVQNDITFDEGRSFIADVENILATMSYSEHFRDIFDQAGTDGARKVELCVVYALVLILGNHLTPPAVLEADVVLLEYFIDTEPRSVMLYVSVIEEHTQQRLWGDDNNWLSARLKFKIACLHFNLRVKQRVLHDKRLQHSDSEKEFLGLVSECTTHDQVVRFWKNSLEESHDALAHSTLSRTLQLISTDDVQDDPPVQADLAVNLVSDCRLQLSVMLYFVKKAEIQCRSLEVFAYLLSTKGAAAATSFGKHGIVGVLNTIMWGHVTSPDVCGKYLDCALLLTTRKQLPNRKRFATEETLAIVNSIMTSHPENRSIILKCCRFVTQLSANAEAVRLLVLSSGINDNMIAFLEKQIIACDDEMADVICRLAITLCADRLEDQIRFFSSPQCIALYIAIMNNDPSRKVNISGHFCRLLLVVTEPQFGFVVENLQKCNFAAELQRLIRDFLRFNVSAMLSCLRFVYFVCQASVDFRMRFHASGVVEQLLGFLQANSNNSDAIITSTHTLLSLCENTQKNLFVVMSRGNIFDFARILRNNASNGKICKSVCTMLVKLSGGGEKYIQSQFASSDIAPELALTLQNKRVHPDVVQSVLLLIIHLVNVVNVLGTELITAEIPSISMTFSTESWSMKHRDLAKLTRDALVHDDVVKYDLLLSSGAKVVIDVLYVHQNIIEYADSSLDTPQITEVGILLKEVKSQKDVEFIIEKLVKAADDGDVQLCLKTFKTINIAIDDITSDKVHFALARSLVENPSLVCGAMAACLQTAEVQTFGFNIIKLLPYYLEDKHDFGEHGECDLIYLAIRRHIRNTSLVESGLECGAVLAAARYENKKHFGKLDGLRSLRFIIESYEDNAMILAKCFNLVVTICTGCTEIQDALHDSGFLSYLQAFLNAHQGDEDVVHSCCEVIYGLFAQDNVTNNTFLTSLDSMNLYLDVLNNNVTSTISCSAISRLIMAITNESSEQIVSVLLSSKAASSLMQVLLNGSSNGIITKVIKLVTLLIVYFICNFPSMRNQFLDKDFIAYLSDVAESPKTNEQISKSVQVALKKLNKLKSKQNLNSALNYIDQRKVDVRRKGAAKKIGRRASQFIANRRRFQELREAEERITAITQEMDELSFFHEFHEALNLAVKFVKPQFARDTLRRATVALQECGEASSKSPLASSFLQNLEFFFSVMSAFLSFEDIQMAAIDVFHCLEFSPEEYQNFGDKGGFNLVLPILQRHISNSNICFGLLKCTGEYLQDDTALNRGICGQDKRALKVISKIISVYMENSDNVKLRDEFRTVIYTFLQNLCFKAPLNKNKICEIGVTAQLTRFMLDHPSDAATVTSTCAVLMSLCDDQHQKNLSVVMNHSNIQGFVRIIRNNANSSKICKSVTALLVGLSGGGEKFIQSELSKSGIATELAAVLGDFRHEDCSVPVKVEWTVIMLVLHLVCNISSMTNEFIAANMAPQLEHYLTPEAEAKWDIAMRQSADMALRKLRKHAKAAATVAARTSKVVSSP